MRDVSQSDVSTITPCEVSTNQILIITWYWLLLLLRSAWLLLLLLRHHTSRSRRSSSRRRLFNIYSVSQSKNSIHRTNQSESSIQCINQSEVSITCLTRACSVLMVHWWIFWLGQLYPHSQHWCMIWQSVCTSVSMLYFCLKTARTW